MRILAVAAGVLTGAAEAALLVVAAAALIIVSPVPPVRRRLKQTILRYGRRAARWELRRIAVVAGEPTPEPLRANDFRVFLYLAARSLPAALGLLSVTLLWVGIWLAAMVLLSVSTGVMSVGDFVIQVVIGSILLAVDLQAMAAVARLDRRLARDLLESDSRAVLQRRVSELAISRAEVVDAVDAERQRIERDLHDGLQQHLVALGMLLGRARRSRDPARAAELLDQAHADAQQAVEELRSVAWRVYPAALHLTTLDEVLAMVAQRSALPVRITYDVPVRPARPVETVLYFVACEAITNAVKHAAAEQITVDISSNERTVEMRIRDDGKGGADPAGGGLHGLTRRVAALDGWFEVHSPPGGPTTIRAELPCG
jgi:signal transduction histidine kinase